MAAATATAASAPPRLTPQVAGTIYAFGGAGSPAQDGAEPKGTLTAVTVGGRTVLFGRTAIGGSNGCGTIFSLNPDGSGYNLQYRFGGSDGCDPRHDAMVVNPGDGRLYATTQGVNQTNNDTYGNWGQVFSFAPGTSIPTPINAVHTFAKPSPKKAPYDGAQQHSSFSIDPVTGIFYGQSAAGGAGDEGMLYAMKSDGAFSDHGYLTPVTVGGRLLLFGMTQCGGAGPKNASCKGNGDGSGVIFALDPAAAPGTSGAFAIVHSFQSASSTDGALPYGSLMYDGTWLYGTTSAGGQHDKGTVFRFAPVAPGSNASVSLLYQFGGNANDGIKPIDNVIKVGNTLYGMTVYGGVTGPSPDDSSVNGNGTVFAIPLPN